MRSFAGLVLVVCPLLTPYVSGGAITSGSMSFGNDGTSSASFQGADFRATINDFDIDELPDGGFPPFFPPIRTGGGVGYGSAGMWSGVTYSGVFYNPPSFNLPRGFPYAGISYSLFLTSPQPMITGPGLYPVTFSVQMSFCVSDPTGSIANYYCEDDTGVATGAFDATPCGCGNTWVFVDGLSLTIADPTVAAPEPSTLSYIGLTLSFGFFVTRTNRKRFGRIVTASLQRQRHG